MLKAKIQETNAHAVWAQDSQDHAFAVERRAGADSEVDLIDDWLAIFEDRITHLIDLWHWELNASILRNTSLSDVDASHQLDGGEHCVLQ